MTRRGQHCKHLPSMTKYDQFKQPTGGGEDLLDHGERQLDQQDQYRMWMSEREHHMMDMTE